MALADIIDAGAAAAEITAAGGEGRAFHVDVSDEASVGKLVQDVVEAYGGVDVLVNNAALWADLEYKPFWEQTPEEWDRVLGVNVKGIFLLCREVFPHMRAQGSGKIINIGSITAE